MENVVFIPSHILRNVGQVLLLKYEFTFWELHGRFLILTIVGFDLPQEHHDWWPLQQDNYVLRP
jgi:hypothetical protein